MSLIRCKVDEDHDRRMDFKEFQWCMSMCGLKMSRAKAEAGKNLSYTCLVRSRSHV